MSNEFPRTTVEGISLPRLIIGCNWISGFSHCSASKDCQIRATHSKIENTSAIFETFLNSGVDAVLGLFGVDLHLSKAVKLAEEKTGKKLIIIDEPIINTENSAQARSDAKKEIQASAKRGATFCLPLHSCIEPLVNRQAQTIDRLTDYTYMIREAGMIPGLSAHMPEVIQYTDLNGYDIATYIQIYNALGFLMQVEVESVAKIIQVAKKPVITIKPMAAGRTTPFIGLNFVFNTIREQDMVCLGTYNASEAEEDVEIALAAILRRPPVISLRNSPLSTSVINGQI